MANVENESMIVGYTCHAYYGPGAAYKMTYDEAVAYWQSQGY